MKGFHSYDMSGKFIAIYGINNLGKSTQAKLLAERLTKEGYKAENIKYPIYDLEPSGNIINDYFRNGNPYELTARESQIIHVVNRTQYEPILKEKLTAGINVIVEDYTGSGLSWGIGTGVDEAFMKRINNHLLKEDIAFVFSGKRFIEAIEATHIHEKNSDLQKHVSTVYERLGHELNWIPVNANGAIEDIHETLWQQVKKVLH